MTFQHHRRPGKVHLLFNSLGQSRKVSNFVAACQTLLSTKINHVPAALATRSALTSTLNAFALTNASATVKCALNGNANHESSSERQSSMQRVQDYEKEGQDIYLLLQGCQT